MSTSPATLWKFGRLSLLVLLSTSALIAPQVSCAAPPPGYKLAWSDEFHQGVGASPDPATWSYETGGGGWGNSESETYVNDTKHAQIVADPKADDGQALEILSTHDNGFESVRMVTADKKSFQYGFIEARIRMPYGQGIWPAFWMLGDNIKQVGWPRCGEVDIMENIGKKSWWGRNESSLHSGAADNPHENVTKNASYNLPAGQSFHSGYHLFQMLWAKDAISFYVDGSLYETRTASEYGKDPWPFNAPFFLLLNTAVGGNWPGAPDATTAFPQKMLVDYIRVYRGASRAPAAPAKLTAKPADGGQILLSWPGDVSATTYNLYRSAKPGDEGAAPLKTGIAKTWFLDTDIAPGSRFYYRVAAVNSAGTSRQSREVSATALAAVESPYGPMPAHIPGTIQIEDYDKGGEGVGYRADDAINSGGEYRPGDGVDIASLSDSAGSYVGWTAAGQWLKYTVDVAAAGAYDVAFRVAAVGAGGRFHLEDARGSNLSGPISVPNTGGWTKWITVKTVVALNKGRQTLKIVEDSGGYNLDEMTFTELKLRKQAR